jgi:hypothetical protein
MKASIAALALVTLALASPLEIRQSTGITENEYTRSGCRNVIFFFARGSTEVGNMVSVPLPTVVLVTHLVHRALQLDLQPLMD